MEASQAKIQRNQTLLASSRKAPAKDLSWGTALQLLKKNNLTWLQAQSSLEQIELDRRQFIRQQLNPRIYAVSSLGTALSSIGDISSDSIGIRLLGNINIPNPTTIQASRYALELQYYMRRLDITLLERRLQVSLYTYFLQQEALDSEPTPFITNKRNTPPTASEIAAISSRNAHSNRNSTRRANSIRLQLNRILNTPGHNWKPLPKTLAPINYAQDLSAIKFENGYGRIALQQAAGQLESSFANLARIKFSQIPLFNTSIALPSIYNSQSDRDLDLGETRLFGSITKSIDFSGTQAKNMKRAEERAIFIQHTLIQRLEGEQYRLHSLLDNFRQLIAEEAKINEELTWLKKFPPSPNSEEIITHLQKTDKLKNQRHQNHLAQKQLSLQLWIWDDRKWPVLKF